MTLALIGASRFVSLLETLLVLLSYWSIIYITILAQEHLIFRKGSFANYTWSEVDCPDLLPKGFASGLSLCFGIVGAILGMSQKWVGAFFNLTQHVYAFSMLTHEFPRDSMLGQ